LGLASAAETLQGHDEETRGKHSKRQGDMDGGTFHKPAFRWQI
jgi:hypothetical protein